MASKFIQKYPIPEEFPEILHNFAKEIVRNSPNDILNFGIEYFKALQNKGNIFEYEKNNRNNISIDNAASPDLLQNDKSIKSSSSKRSVHKVEAENFVQNILQESKDFIHRRENSENEELEAIQPQIGSKNDINANLPEDKTSKSTSEYYLNTMLNHVAENFISDILREANETESNKNVLNTF